MYEANTTLIAYNHENGITMIELEEDRRTEYKNENMTTQDRRECRRQQDLSLLARPP